MTEPVRRRTYARELCLQFLYMYEIQPDTAPGELDAFIEHHTKGNRDRKGRVVISEFTRHLCLGIIENHKQIDSWITDVARNWPIERMAHIDRNVLRLGIFELVFGNDDAPPKVIINEAIDLVKRFSTAQSGAFVNGILDRVRSLVADARSMGISHPQPPERIEFGGAGEQIKSKIQADFDDDPFSVVRDAADEIDDGMHKY
ncbi:MAG: transcription antitermination factor NusB [Planctomycetes bacterium]|nr:transcription antitermination factor NusB [Planctomycetota bacterium]